MKKIINTSFYSKRTGMLAEGCRRCVKGEKLVLFVTGLCPRKCWYCPISEKKMAKDVIYANEWKTNKFEDIVREVQLTEASGAGITGGDPLMKPKRTFDFIKKLKETFTDFHIHLYTSLELLDQKKIQMLYEAGLDELRLHPEVQDSSLWEKIEFVKGSGMVTGVEIPVIPGKEKQTKKLIDYAGRFVDFFNLNELEISEVNKEKFQSRQLKTTDYIAQSIKGSRDLGEKLLLFCLSKNIRCHFCTAKLKDAAQLKNRIKRRAMNVATVFDETTGEGMLIRPVIYGSKQNLQQYLNKRNIAYVADEKEKRVFIDPYILHENLGEIKEKGFRPAVVEEYPTWDATKIQVDYL